MFEYLNNALELQETPPIAETLRNFSARGRTTRAPEVDIIMANLNPHNEKEKGVIKESVTHTYSTLFDNLTMLSISVNPGMDETAQHLVNLMLKHIENILYPKKLRRKLCNGIEDSYGGLQTYNDMSKTMIEQLNILYGTDTYTKTALRKFYEDSETLKLFETANIQNFTDTNKTAFEITYEVARKLSEKNNLGPELMTCGHYRDLFPNDKNQAGINKLVPYITGENGLLNAKDLNYRVKSLSKTFTSFPTAEKLRFLNMTTYPQYYVEKITKVKAKTLTRNKENDKKISERYMNIALRNHERILDVEDSVDINNIQQDFSAMESLVRCTHLPRFYTSIQLNDRPNMGIEFGIMRVSNICNQVLHKKNLYNLLRYEMPLKREYAELVKQQNTDCIVFLDIKKAYDSPERLMMACYLRSKLRMKDKKLKPGNRLFDRLLYPVIKKDVQDYLADVSTKNGLSHLEYKEMIKYFTSDARATFGLKKTHATYEHGADKVPEFIYTFPLKYREYIH